MQRFLGKRWETVILLGAVFIVFTASCLVLSLSVPGFKHFSDSVMGGIKVTLKWIAIVLGWIIYLVLPLLIGLGTSWLIYRFDDANPDEDISGWYKALAMGVFGLVVMILYLLLLVPIVKIPVMGAIYGGPFNLPNLTENVFSQWGWLIWAYVLYIVGCLIHAGNREQWGSGY